MVCDLPGKKILTIFAVWKQGVTPEIPPPEKFGTHRHIIPYATGPNARHLPVLSAVVVSRVLFAAGACGGIPHSPQPSAMDFAGELLNVVLTCTAFGTLLCGWLLLLCRRDSDRARTMLAGCFLLCGAVVAVRVAMGYGGWPLSHEVLLISDLNSGLFTLLIFFLYPVEAIVPGWLNWKKGLFLLAPWVVLNMILIALPHIRRLDTFSDLAAYAGEFNVWIRLVFLALFIPLCSLLLYLPHDYRKSSVDNRWIRIYTVGTQGICVLYLLSMLTGYTLVNALHIAYCMSFCLVVTYQELYQRMTVPAETAAAPGRRPSGPDATARAADPLWAALDALMEREQLWRNPDLTLEDLAARLNSNRTTLSRLIRQNGCVDYRHFINRRRIAEFLKIADSDRRINIQDTFFRVGFRSHMTALRYFREYTGTTPSEYLQNLPGEV